MEKPEDNTVNIFGLKNTRKKSFQEGDYDSEKTTGSSKRPSRQPSFRDLEKTGNVNSVGSNASGKSEDENAMSFIQLIKYQYRGNKDLDEKLNKLMDLCGMHFEKYEERISDMKNRADKAIQSNELLIKTLKTCEKEVDNLAQTNANLHKSLVFFQEEVSKRDNKEKEFKKLTHNQNQHIAKLRLDIENITREHEILLRKMTVSDAKTNGLQGYVKSCEDSICAINITLK
jgi:hypothetical protein